MSRPGPGFAPTAASHSRVPDIALYPAALRSLVDLHGAAAINQCSCEALGYPALLITHMYEERSVLGRWKEMHP